MCSIELYFNRLDMANLIKILKLIDRKAELEAELEELKSKFESIPIEI